MDENEHQLREEDLKVVDWVHFAKSRAELGPSFIRILGYFREDGEKSVAKIEDAMQRRDATALVIPAHTLKTEARQFGADPLGDMAEEIEFAARRSIEQRLFPDELIPTVAKLRPLYRQTIDLFDREINPLLERKPGFGRAGSSNQDFGRL